MKIHSIKRIILLGVLCAVPLHGYYYSDSRNYSAAETSFIVAGTVAAVSAVGYGFYKCYEHFALKSAQARLEKQKLMVAQFVEVESALTKWLQDVYLIEKCADISQRNEYDQLCGAVLRLESQLSAIRHDLNKALQSWSGVEKAAYFLQSAQVLSGEVNYALERIGSYIRHINQRAALLELISLLQTENSVQNALIVRLVSATLAGQITEALVRGQFAQSQWPLLEAHAAIEKRKQAYFRVLPVIDGFAHQSELAQAYGIQGHNVMHAYNQALENIAGFKNYTKELRAHAQWQQEQRRLEAERIQAQAALRAAQAQEQQARVMRDQAVQNKQHELAQLRHELSEIKRQIDAGDTNYYLKQQKRNLQNRIQALKHELGQDPSFFGVILDLITDND